MVRQAAPRTLTLLGIGPVHTAQRLITAGQNIDLLHSDAASARVCAAAPTPAFSGKTTCHRLNPFGDRDADRTLHLITVVRLRYCIRTRAYADRRNIEGLSKREIIRCIKRYLARELYHALRTARMVPDCSIYVSTFPSAVFELLRFYTEPEWRVKEV
ncbi:transposase [Sciscionella marina]|uniref:transposase n=1 Tax=Sciscionella marina TaxID=508770 RepID=UPI000370808F|nr:transposase [Sciscionella marina]